MDGKERKTGGGHTSLRRIASVVFFRHTPYALNVSWRGLQRASHSAEQTHQSFQTQGKLDRNNE
jgi:hypothetical protein